MTLANGKLIASATTGKLLRHPTTGKLLWGALRQSYDVYCTGASIPSNTTVIAQGNASWTVTSGDWEMELFWGTDQGYTGWHFNALTQYPAYQFHMEKDFRRDWLSTPTGDYTAIEDSSYTAFVSIP